MTIPQTRVDELRDKLARLQASVECEVVLRLRGVDWFAWLLCGASSSVLLAAEAGVAEALVVRGEAFVLTDDIEWTRLRDEELPEGVELKHFPWATPDAREHWVRSIAGATPVWSDRPESGEAPLPQRIRELKYVLGEAELHRYAQVGATAAAAMTETLGAAQPQWSENELAGAGARALLARGLAPALILAAGARRLPLYRHPLPTSEPIGNTAMLVFCARGYGLYANLTRFVSFGAPSAEQADRHARIRRIEAEALARCRPGVALSELYADFAEIYRRHGHAEALVEHHQGGLTGYQAREVVARPDSIERLEIGVALALNPSLRGVKIEDTFFMAEDGLRNLTFDPAWPHVDEGGRLRPRVLER